MNGKGKRFNELTARVHGRDKEIVSNFYCSTLTKEIVGFSGEWERLNSRLKQSYSNRRDLSLFFPN